MLVVASMIQAVAFALHLPARIEFSAELVEPSQIGPAVVLSQTANEAMRLVAPALAGVLIGASWFGVGGVFLLAAQRDGRWGGYQGPVIASVRPGEYRLTKSVEPSAENTAPANSVLSRALRAKMRGSPSTLTV